MKINDPHTNNIAITRQQLILDLLETQHLKLKNQLSNEN